MSKLLSKKEVATLMGVSVSTVDRYSIPGRLKIGGSVRYDQDAIVRWLEAKKAECRRCSEVA